MPASQPKPIVVTYTAAISPETARTLAVLRRAVAEALDRKRRLGQCGVFWEDSKVVRVEAKDLPALP